MNSGRQSKLQVAISESGNSWWAKPLFMTSYTRISTAEVLYTLIADMFSDMESRLSNLVKCKKSRNRKNNSNRSPLITSQSSWFLIRLKKPSRCPYILPERRPSTRKPHIEQVNAVIRQYIPMHSSFIELTQKQLANIEYKRNNRLRKKLEYRTPFERFFLNLLIGGIGRQKSILSRAKSLLPLLLTICRGFVVVSKRIIKDTTSRHTFRFFRTKQMIAFQALQAISPIDGRYRDKVATLSRYFSEESLIRYRVQVEVEYFIALCSELPSLKDVCTPSLCEELRRIYTNFSEADAARVKEIEAVTNHDVKAVEYFLKERFETLGIGEDKEFIHFGLTSQDINNTAFPMMIREAIVDIYIPALQELVEQLHGYALEWEDIPMLAKTHGQPASPTRLGKEIEVFVYRLRKQIEQLEAVPHSGKFGGATGNFNAHHVAYPEHDWKDFGRRFLAILGLDREEWTTQISNYDNMAALFDACCRINVILIDLCRDFWQYISMEYFKQKIKAGEVGSSAMPHKVNPIDYENAEGNLGIANAIYEHLSRKLPISRLQRDLTDSTVLRNVGVPLAHSLIAVSSIRKGLGKLLLNETALERDLQNNYAVVAEAIQTILRRESYPNPYETLKALTRTNEAITADSIAQFIETLEVDEAVKREMRKITPSNYIGI